MRAGMLLIVNFASSVQSCALPHVPLIVVSPVFLCIVADADSYDTTCGLKHLDLQDNGTLNMTSRFCAAYSARI